MIDAASSKRLLSQAERGNVTLRPQEPVCLEVGLVSCDHLNITLPTHHSNIFESEGLQDTSRINL